MIVVNSDCMADEEMTQIVSSVTIVSDMDVPGC